MPMYPTPDNRHSALSPELIEFCRQQRQNSTSPENLLWHLLRNRRLLGYKFRRQHIQSGYCLDFYCSEAKLSVELDGGGHLSAAQAAHDQYRTQVLSKLGISVIRFWNNQMLQETQAVPEEIAYHLIKRTSEQMTAIVGTKTCGPSSYGSILPGLPPEGEWS